MICANISSACWIRNHYILIMIVIIMWKNHWGSVGHKNVASVALISQRVPLKYPNVVSLLAHCQWRWANNKPSLARASTFHYLMIDGWHGIRQDMHPRGRKLNHLTKSPMETNRFPLRPVYHTTNMKGWTTVYLMLGHRLRSWPNTKSTVVQR